MDEDGRIDEQHDGDVESAMRRTVWGRPASKRRRFLARYEARRAERHHPLKRPIRVTVGVLLILGGVAIGWLPGPGFIILALPGALLIASEWRRAALLMDRVEAETIPYVRRVHARLRGGPKPEWVEEDPQLWGVWEDRRVHRTSDTGERRRRTDVERGERGHELGLDDETRSA